jgi:magnesium chelatase accessory protein
MPAAPLDWATDGRDWPNRSASRFVTAGGTRLHVQLFGAGEPLLLLHGTGASSHSFRALAPLLAARYAVIVPDLPGHGFSERLPGARQSLDGICEALGALLGALGLRPAFAAGHSAGAALAVHMTLTGRIAPRALASLNGALLPWRGLPAVVFAPLARLMAGAPLVSRLFAWRAGAQSAVARLVAGTGSVLDAEGVEWYARLVRNPAHVAGALAMMANWDLAALERDLPRLAVPLLLVVGGNDRTVPPRDAALVAARVPHARLVSLPGLGHLAHEECPRRVAELLLEFAARSAR